MTRRYLIGPVNARFATEHPIAAPADSRLFGRSGTDFGFQPGESWADLQARLPAGWTPDALILRLGYTALPSGWETAPIPVIGEGPDWPLHWHYYRRIAPHLDRLWVDARGAKLLRAAGVAQVRPVLPFGRPVVSPMIEPSASRDIDLLWVGNFNPAIHRERLRWAFRLARLGERHRIVIAPTLDPVRYRPLLARSRTVFLPSFEGGWDALVPEALAAGTAIIRDTGVTETMSALRPGAEYVAFQDDNLEEVVESLLTDEPRCRRIAAAGQARAKELGTPALWARAESTLDAESEDLAAAVLRRCSAAPAVPAWELRHWQFLNTRTAFPEPVSEGADSGERLAAAIRAAWSTAASTLDPLRTLTHDAEVGLAASLHLAEALTESGRSAETSPLVCNVLERLADPGDLPPSLLDHGPLRPGFHPFRVEWERAGFTYPADPVAEAQAKRNLLLGRCEVLLGQITRDTPRLARAAAIAPTLTPVVKAAAVALARADFLAAAVPLFERAVAADPFDRKTVSGLADVLERAGLSTQLDRLRRDRRFLDAAQASDAVAAPVQRAPTSSHRRQRVSLTMIVKNEESNLPACLDSVRDLVDEIVIVDTGSTDATIERAVERGARVVKFAWTDDFAAARNAALEAAHGDWILWLDADERLGPAARSHLRKLFAELKDENAAYMMRQQSQSPDPMGANTAVDQIRLFRNRSDVRWEYRIHEQILLSIRRTNAKVRKTPIVIDHHGYEDPALRQSKMQRNTRLLELAHAEKPEDPVLAFNLAWVYQRSNKAERALPLLELCRQRLNPQMSIVPKVYRLLAQVFDQLGRTTDALETFAAGRRLWPRDIELLLHQGLLFRKLKDYQSAEGNFRKILELPAENYPVGLDLALRTYKTRNALAELLLEQGKLVEAETEWQAAVSEQPRFTPGWVGLAEIALARNRCSEAAQLLDRVQPTDSFTRERANRIRQRIATSATEGPSAT